MNKRTNPEMLDDENPEWIAQDVARARPAHEVLPGLFGLEVAQDMLKPRGRPKTTSPKERMTLRLDADVLARWRASGKGWQTRAAQALTQAAPDMASLNKL